MIDIATLFFKGKNQLNHVEIEIASKLIS